MRRPTVKQTGSFFRFDWQDEEVQASVSRIYQHRDGKVDAELKFTTSKAGWNPHIHQTRLNLLATRSRQDVAKVLAERLDAPWELMLEQLCTITLDRIRAGEPVIELSTDREIQRPEYLLAPILPLGKPTIIFGLGGSGKSYLALALGICALLPWQDNTLGLVTSDRVTNVLYLDWETDEAEIAWRLKCLREGLGLPHLWLQYRRCALPLADDVERIQEAIMDHHIGLIIVDSVGGAGGGDLNGPESAIRLFAAIRQLNVTSLLLAHTAKNGDGKSSTPYGSAFFTNFARSVWELKKVQEEGDDTIQVGLFHRKTNFGRLHRPLGFTISFTSSTTNIKKTDVKGVVELAAHLSQPVRIREALKSGKMTVKELAEELGTTDASVRAALARMVKQNEVMKMGDYWGLAAEAG